MENRPALSSCKHYTSAKSPRKASCFSTDVVRQKVPLSPLPMNGAILGQQAAQHEAKMDWISTVPETGARGRIDIFAGPMFAGKSTTLLKRVREELTRGRRVVLLKSNKDNRYGSPDHVVTHVGDRMRCLTVNNLEEFRDEQEAMYQSAEVIAIDEAQFFPDLLDFCCEAADLNHKHVYVAGLDGDYQRQTFGRIMDLVPHADSFTKLKGCCAFCSAESLFSLRVVADTRQELVGGGEVYKPVCRYHYRMLQQVRTQRPPQS